jgi:hypothetical protein
MMVAACSSSPTTTTGPSLPPDAAPAAAEPPDATPPPPDAAPTRLTAAQLQKIASCDPRTCIIKAPISELAARPLTDKKDELANSHFTITARDFPTITRLPWVRKLTVRGDGTIDTKHLAGLTELDTLYLPQVDFPDFATIATLTKLERLSASPPSVTSLAGLEKLTELRNLSIGHMANLPAGELGHLKDLVKLEQLAIVHLPKITNVAALSKMDKLAYLEINVLPVKSLAPVAKLPALKTVLLNSLTKLRTVGPLGRLPALTNLQIAYMPRVRYVGLGRSKSLTELTIEDPTITRAPAMRGMVRLRILSFRNCVKLTNIRALRFAGLRKLTDLILEHTAVKSTAAVAGLRKLERIDIRFTGIKKIMPLARLRSLKEIRYTRGITDMEAFEKRRPKVNLNLYAPRRKRPRP